jgi:hypothetical protein
VDARNCLALAVALNGWQHSLGLATTVENKLVAQGHAYIFARWRDHEQTPAGRIASREARRGLAACARHVKASAL